MRMMVGQDDVEWSVQVGPDQDRPESFGHFRSRFDAGQAGTHDDDREQPWRFGPAGERLEMGVEPGPSVVTVHVEGILSHAGEGRAEELAAEGEDEPIIGKGSWPARRWHCG